MESWETERLWTRAMELWAGDTPREMEPGDYLIGKIEDLLITRDGVGMILNLWDSRCVALFPTRGERLPAEVREGEVILIEYLGRGDRGHIVELSTHPRERVHPRQLGYFTRDHRRRCLIASGSLG